ncbi:hypothetical protein G6F48_013664 [Rhizopus delemar]|nr:hypothetical protein G6F48_013664 [Rhizopus delemar]
MAQWNLFLTLPGEEDFLVIPCKLLNKCEFLGLYLDASVPFDARDIDKDLTGTESWRGDGLPSEHKFNKERETSCRKNAGKARLYMEAVLMSSSHLHAHPVTMAQTASVPT